MGEIADYRARPSVPAAPHADDEALERRLLRSMCVWAAAVVVVSLFAAPWRVTTGLALGGALSLVNHAWLRGSIAAAFGGAGVRRPRLGAARYVLRYFFVASAVWAAAALDLVSVPAALAGLCSFVAALFAEAARQFYASTFDREDN